MTFLYNTNSLRSAAAHPQTCKVLMHGGSSGAGSRSFVLQTLLDGTSIALQEWQGPSMIIHVAANRCYLCCGRHSGCLPACPAAVNRE